MEDGEEDTLSEMEMMISDGEVFEFPLDGEEND